MELRHLRYFIAVAEESTFVAAARRLRIAQPALTRQVHDLEREIGVDLFDRTARGVDLTPAGDACLSSARHILRQVEAAIARARGSSLGIVGRCAICVGVRAMSSGLIARITARVQSEFPGIELVLTEGILLRQWNAIQVGEVDIGLGLAPSSDYSDLASETIDHNIFDAVLISSTDELAARAHVSIHDMQARPFLSYRSSIVPEYARQQKVAFGRIGFEPVRTREFDDIYSIVTLVAAGQGWALFPTSTMPLAGTGTTVVPLSDFRLLLPLAVISRRDESRPVVHSVLAVIRRMRAAERASAANVADEPE